MGILNEARREFIAAPDSAKGQIVYKWPDQNIRKFSRAIVEPDAVAVFMSQGQVMGRARPGQHTLDAKELPFLGMFVDWATGGNAFKAEIYFVGTREFPNIRFGGRLDEVQDPQTGLIVTLRDVRRVLAARDRPDQADPQPGRHRGRHQQPGDHRLGHPAAAEGDPYHRHHPADVGCLADPRPVHAQPRDRGGGHAGGQPRARRLRITITRLGNLDINLDDDDNARLKKLAGDTAYSRLAGGFLQAAQAEALQGAGEGMAKGGEGVAPMFLGAGMGMAGQMMQAPRRRRTTPAARPGFAGGGPGFATPQQQAPRHPPSRRPRPRRRPLRPPRLPPRPRPRLRQLPEPGAGGREVLPRVRHADAEALRELQRQPELRPPSSAPSAARRRARRRHNSAGPESAMTRSRP